MPNAPDGLGTARASRDALMALIAQAIRPYTHPGGHLASWARHMPTALSYARYGVSVTAPLTAVFAWRQRMDAAWIMLAATCILLGTDLIDGPWARTISGPTDDGADLDYSADLAARWSVIVATMAGSVLTHLWWLAALFGFRLLWEWPNFRDAQRIWNITDDPEFPYVPLGRAEWFLDFLTGLLILAACIDPATHSGQAVFAVGAKCFHKLWRYGACHRYLRQLILATERGGLSPGNVPQGTDEEES